MTRFATLSNMSAKNAFKSPARKNDRREVMARRSREWYASPGELVRLERSQSQVELEGKKVLVVDDDIRNVFALTSALEQHGMQVLHAESGKEGIEMLKADPDIDLVLMDVMMPGLDGLDTIRIVRSLEGYRELPIIAVTAKAMVGDREKCIASGASDYLAKPVNVDVLVATLWRALQATVT